MAVRCNAIIPVLAAIMLITAGCTSESGDSESAGARAQTITIPEPNLREAEPRVRSTITAARARVAEHPTSAEEWGRLGNVLFPHDMFDEALIAYREALRLEPDRFEWMYMLGVTLELRGVESGELEGEGGLDWFRRAQQLRPEDPALHLRIGEAHARRGRPEEAVLAFQRAHERSPEDPFPLRRLGETLLLIDRPEEARDALERCRRLAPQAAEPAIALLQALTRLDEDEEADRIEAELPRLTEGTIDMVDPTVAHVMAHGVSTVLLFPRAVDLANVQRHDEALRLFRICEEVHPESPRLNAWIGTCLLALGNRAEARVHFERALRNFAQEYRALIGLVQLEIQEGNLDRARTFAQRATEAVPENSQGYALLGLIAAMTGDPIQAVRRYREAEERGPLTARDLYNLAEAHVTLREIPDAGRRLQQAIQRDPRYIAPRLRLGELLERLGRTAEARAQYAEILRIDPGHATALERFRTLPAD